MPGKEEEDSGRSRSWTANSSQLTANNYSSSLSLLALSR
jgi:hypothetical protein